MPDSGEPWIKATARVPQENLTLPRLLKRADMTRQTGLPKEEHDGYRRARFTSLWAISAFCSLVTIGAGQHTPTHSTDADHIIIGLKGEVSFAVGGGEFRISAEDLLLIPSDAPYRYFNNESSPAWFFSIVSRDVQWPPTSTYWDD